MEIKDFILAFGDKAKELISYYEGFKDLTGEQKKDRVVDVLTDFIENGIDKLPINAILKIFIKKGVIAILPHLVQLAYNLIKSKVEGITK